MTVDKMSWIVVAWVAMLSGVTPLSAQEITESWVAEQLGRSRAAEPLVPDERVERGMPILSLMIRYLPATGELTLASAAALRPLYDALLALAPTPFRVVCCTGLPAEREAGLARQLVDHMSRLFAARQPHVQFQVQIPHPTVSDPPQTYPDDAARIEVYRLP